LINHIGRWSIAIFRHFIMPFPVTILKLDGHGGTANLLHACSRAGGGQSIRVGAKCLRKDIAHPVGPSAIMFDNAIGDFGHAFASGRLPPSPLLPRPASLVSSSLERDGDISQR